MSQFKLLIALFIFGAIIALMNLAGMDVKIPLSILVFIGMIFMFYLALSPGTKLTNPQRFWIMIVTIIAVLLILSLVNQEFLLKILEVIKSK